MPAMTRTLARKLFGSSNERRIKRAAWWRSSHTISVEHIKNSIELFLTTPIE
jgi:hypothetical protein